MSRLDPVTLGVVRGALAGIAEEMNAVLVRSSYSPNVKERRDCSCALFDAQGRLIAQSESMPVHLGAMPFSVRAALERFPTLGPGDTVVLNDPFCGGAHLPDLTFVSPVFFEGRRIGYAANRAHHADVGGSTPGSVSATAEEIFQEGLRLPPVRLWRGGELETDLLEVVLANVRTPQERLGDLRAQWAANRLGQERLGELAGSYGADRLAELMEGLLAYAERRMRKALAALPAGRYAFEDALEDDGRGGGPLPLRVRLTLGGGQITVDFSGSAPQVEAPVNAVLAVTVSAVYYAVRAFADPDVPPNAGAYRPIHLHVPEGTFLNARPPAPVVGGNLETSQRIVDVVLGALAQVDPRRVPAACQGTMNNLTLGGHDPRSGAFYTLYETIAGGFGGRAGLDGIDGVHVHMTNTLNTPVEALELAYPLRVERYELRPDSGGAGRYRGGLGVRRDIRVLGHEATLSLLSERRTSRPYGLLGGEPGQPGENVLIRGDHEEPLPAKCVLRLRPNDVISVRTPGGGGYGPPAQRDPEARARDRREGKMSSPGRAPSPRRERPLVTRSTLG